MSGAEPLPPTVVLTGEVMDAFIGSIDRLSAAEPVIIGGLAVMSRVGGEHRPTLDIDSAFDNETDTPTTALLVASGIATEDDAIQRVRIDGAVVDVIDTIPIDPLALPDDPAQRLFVCAHRYAFETATPVTFVGASNRATVPVATVEALVAMKAHALRFGRPQRRALKRPSDLYDIVRLATAGTEPLLTGAAWGLQEQVRAAIADDLADVPAAAAVLQGSPVQAISEIDADVLGLVVDALLRRLTVSPNERQALRTTKRSVPMPTHTSPRQFG